MVFPRLLGTDELTLGAPGVVVISERTEQCVIALVLRPGAEVAWQVVEWDTDLGPTTHHGVRALLEHHLRLPS